MRNARVLSDTPTMRPTSTVRRFLELFTLARSDSAANYRYDLGIRVTEGIFEVGGKLGALRPSSGRLQRATWTPFQKCRVILPDHHVRRNLGVVALRDVAGLHPATNAITLDG
jgi:hypothetical protein